MKKIIITATIVFALLINLSGIQALTQNIDTNISLKSSLGLSDDLISLPEVLLNLVLEDKQSILKTDEVIDRYLVTDLFINNDKANVTTVIIGVDGNIVAAIKGYIQTTRMIDSRTLVFDNKSHITFWNLETNEQEHIESLGYHHDYEYNPLTETFLGLGREKVGTVEVGGEDLDIEYDTIFECLQNGTVLWEWRGSEHIPFNITEYYLFNETRKGPADWCHGNALHWDIENDYIYFNARSLSTVFKIDKKTGDVLWQVGAYESDFIMYDKCGNEKPGLFYGAHDIQHVGNNHFTIFDNDYHNRTDYASVTSRFVEFVIDEDNMIAREVFSYEGPSPSHYSGNRAGVDKLPHNTYLGSFCGNGLTPMKYWTEVNQAGEVIWELAINETLAFRSEVFYAQPLFEVDQESLTSIRKENGFVNFTVWNSYRSRITTDGNLSIYDSDTLLLEHNFEFLPEWEPTELSIEIPLADYSKGSYNLTIIIENSDGLQAVGYIIYTIEAVAVEGWVIGVSVSVAAIVLIGAGGATYFYKKKK